MFKKILVPTDGSERSEQAIQGAIELAKALSTEILLLTVVEPYSYTNLSEYRPETIDEYDTRVTLEADACLDKAHDLCLKAGLTKVRTEVVKAFSPAEAIIEAAQQHQCDLILMASHGRKGISALLLGSETQKVLTHSRIPVLVYR